MLKAFAFLDFDKNQIGSVPHNQIDFTAFAPPSFTGKGKSPTNVVPSDSIFSGLTSEVTDRPPNLLCR
jgi:hypothetical protein